jgi:hypothetical protein
MKKDEHPKTFHLLLRKYWIAFFICLLLVFIDRSNGQVRDGIKPKDILVEMSQSEREAHIQSLLDSGSPNDQAWGAYWAAKHGMANFAPQLIRLVDPMKSKQVRESGVFRMLFYLLPSVSSEIPSEQRLQICNHYRDLAILDSLIQLNASVSSEQLLPLYDHYPDQVLILLAKSPKENSQALLELARKESSDGIFWITACNLLETAKAAGFAAFLIDGIKIDIEITVTDKNGGPIARTIDRIIPQMTISYHPKLGNYVSLDLPPIDDYKLTHIANVTSGVIAPGKIPIYYIKEACYPETTSLNIGEEGRPKQSDFSSIRQRLHRMPKDYLADLLDWSTPKYIPSTKYFFNIDWENSEQLSKEIIRIGNELHSPFRFLLYDLFSAGWLTESEAKETGFNVRFEVRDFRANRSVALPDTPPSCKRIQISN